MNSPPELLEVREKILKWNYNWRVTIDGGRLEVHNQFADFGQILWGIDGEGLGANQIALCLHFNEGIKSILRFYEDWICSSSSEWMANVLSPGNVLEVVIDEFRAMLKSCDEPCMEKVESLCIARGGEMQKKDCLPVVCKSCQKKITDRWMVEATAAVDESEQTPEGDDMEDEMRDAPDDDEMTGIMLS